MHGQLLHALHGYEAVGHAQISRYDLAPTLLLKNLDKDKQRKGDMTTDEGVLTIALVA